jgi:spore maturation protein CgeB
MKILLAGNYSFQWYEEACANALEELGHQVIRFSWGDYFTTFPGKFELYAGLTGPTSWKVNQQLLQTIRKNNIDIAFLWRGTHVTAKTLRLMKQQNPRCMIVSYNNDDPFSPKYYSPNAPLNQRRLWKTFKEAIPEYDINFVYRYVNLEDYQKHGAKKVDILMPYFLPELHFPRKLNSEEKKDYECDIVFVGHYESDGRDIYLKEIVDSGLKLKIFGSGWPKKILTSISPDLKVVKPVLGNEYPKSLCGAKVALCFLSKLNRDTYTRRNIEIPACGVAMLSERTSDLQNIFHEGKEAFYFDNKEEMLEKAHLLVTSNDLRESISHAALSRVWKDGHDVNHKMKYMVDTVLSTMYQK